MKKLLLIALVAIFGMSYAYSQTFVSTDPQPRNIILEEYTGLYCTWCPAGHLIANNLAKDNPGKVFVVNIHSGGYAVPGVGDPDMRIDEGEGLDKSSGLTGYPAGTVNRSTTPWAQGRDKWVAQAATIMQQTSPVNVAVKVSLDPKKRELTTEVEIYYTSASPQTTNKLTVMLLQDDIRGYQEGASKNPENVVGDLYKHNHVLRKIISSGGTFGETIDKTTVGSFISKKYVTVLPETIKNVDLYMYNLKVVAFVAEGNGNIYSGSGADVKFPDDYKADLAMTNLTVFPSDYCFTSIHPKVEVTNSMDKEITSFTVGFSINEGKDNNKTFTGSLKKGEKTTIDWGEIPYSATGNYSMKIKGFTNLNDNTLFDIDFTNNISSKIGTGFTKNAFSTFDINFETGAAPTNVVFDNSQNYASFIGFANGVNAGAKNSKYMIIFYCQSAYQVNGLPAYVMFGLADLSSIAQPYLTYYYAYSDGNTGGTAPTGKLQYSDDCGATWKDIHSETFVETGKVASGASFYIPKTTDYKPVSINLSDFKNKQDIIFRLAGIPGTNGNLMFIDEVSISDGPTTDVEENTENVNYVIYPNPADFEVRLGNEVFLGLNYSIYSLVGELFLKGTNTDNKIDISSLSAGTYVIKIGSETLRFVKK